jgi:hypothetical protein
MDTRFPYNPPSMPYSIRLAWSRATLAVLAADSDHDIDPDVVAYRALDIAQECGLPPLLQGYLKVVAVHAFRVRYGLFSRQVPCGPPIPEEYLESVDLHD